MNMTIEDIAVKVYSLSEILCQDIDDVLRSKDYKPADSSFIAAQAIAHLVGVFAFTLEEINPELTENFKLMIEKKIDLAKNSFKNT